VKVGIVRDPEDMSEFNVITTSENVDLRVVDGVGRVTGFDPATDSAVQNIPSSSYLRTRLDDESGQIVAGVDRAVQVLRPALDKYRVVVSGLAPGTFALSVHSYSKDGSNEGSSAIEGVVGGGSSAEYELEFNSSESAPKAKRIVTYESTLADISAVLALKWIANQGIATSLSQKIRNAAEANVRGNSKTALNLLAAFTKEIQSQQGKNITVDAARILLQDADVLQKPQ
jgi:hypothetical protein